MLSLLIETDKSVPYKFMLSNP